MLHWFDSQSLWILSLHDAYRMNCKVFILINENFYIHRMSNIACCNRQQSIVVWIRSLVILQAAVNFYTNKSVLNIILPVLLNNNKTQQMIKHIYWNMNFNKKIVIAIFLNTNQDYPNYCNVNPWCLNLLSSHTIF